MEKSIFSCLYSLFKLFFVLIISITCYTVFCEITTVYFLGISTLLSKDLNFISEPFIFFIYSLNELFVSSRLAMLFFLHIFYFILTHNTNLRYIFAISGENSKYLIVSNISDIR